MSAHAQMRAMLDQLMGTGRDGDTMRQRIKFTDDRVCKSHLLDSCPHDILSGTRMDLGECMKVHDLALRADYEIAAKKEEYFFELDAAEHLQSFINDCDRRTEMAKKRLVETQDEISAEVAAKAERVHELNEEIGKLLARAEQLGGEGNVDEAQQLLEKVEKTRISKKEAEDVYRNSMPASSFQQQKLRVCEVCSAYLGLHDNDRRLADHFGGKLHLGFIEIREKLEKLRKAVTEKQEKLRVKRQNESGSDGDQDLEAEIGTEMEAVHLPIILDATAHPVLGKKVEIGTENEDIDTRIDTAHIHTLISTRERDLQETAHLIQEKWSALCPKRRTKK
uniref:RNA-binding protein Luc7-like 2 n=1 Tax=Knipowitschia caucasica TaxID=637954 RepID=A0AAV2LMT7_KNICA